MAIKTAVLHRASKKYRQFNLR